MKLIFICLLSCSIFEIYAQSKKERLEYLGEKLDVLNTLVLNENEVFIKRKNQLEASITSQNLKIAELNELILSIKQSLQKLSEENKTLEYQILWHELTLKSIEDSIQKILNEQPIKFLDNSLINVSDKQLIHLMNMKDEDLGEAFVNQQNPEIKPTYEIIGKQLFQLNGKQYCLAVMGVTNPNSYHSLAGTNFLACFEIVNEKWKLLHPPKNTEFVPAVGFGIPAWIDKFVQFGDQKIAVILEGGYTGQGLDLSNRAIYGLDNEKKFHLIYEGKVYKNDSANEGTSMFMNINEEYDIEFKKSTSSKYYDLIETKKSHGKKVKTTTFKFHENTMSYE